MECQHDHLKTIEVHVMLDVSRLNRQ